MNDEKVIYVKYNRHRLPKFQIETSIIKSKSKIIVRKRAITNEAKKHVKSMYEHYKILKKAGLKIAQARLIKDDLVMEYIVGNSLDILILNSALKRDKKKFFYLINKYLTLTKSFKTTTVKKFDGNKEFKRIFGTNAHLNNVICLNMINLDLIFENIIIDKQNNPILIDYEWLFRFQMPCKFIIYRSINLFYHKYSEQLNNFVSFNEILEYAKINQNEQKIFLTMEENFQNYVNGKERNNLINARYAKNEIDLFKEIENKKEELAQKSRELVNVRKEIEEIKKSRAWKAIQSYRKIRLVGFNFRFFAWLYRIPLFIILSIFVFFFWTILILLMALPLPRRDSK